MKNAISFILFTFFCAILCYVLYPVLAVTEGKTFALIVITELIAFGQFLYLLIFNVKHKEKKTAFYITIFGVEILNTIIVSAINYLLWIRLPFRLFLLIHMGVLFVNLIITLPMYSRIISEGENG